MAHKSSEWIPKNGQIVWLSNDTQRFKNLKKALPSWAPGHIALVLHVTENGNSKPRHAWIHLISSLGYKAEEEGRGPKYIHFQYEHIARIPEHPDTKCNQNCRKALHLKPFEGHAPRMKKPGYIDITNVYELPLDLLAVHSRYWCLRDCSFALVTDLARDAIAELVMSWKPYDATERLCPKLELVPSESKGLICWIDATSTALKDCNGETYTGSGPCVVFQVDGAVSSVYIMSFDTTADRSCSVEGPTTTQSSDANPGAQTNRGFKTLEDDRYTIMASIEAPTDSSQDPLTFRYVWPTVNEQDGFCGRKWHAEGQSLILCPSFDTNEDCFYQLPTCFLPAGTRILEEDLALAQDPASVAGRWIDLCGSVRECRDKEKNAAAEAIEDARKLKEAKEIEKAEELQRKAYEVLLKRQNDELLQLHQEILEQLDVKLDKISVVIERVRNMNIVGKRGRQTRDPARRLTLLDWLETELLLCTARARLEDDGALILKEYSPHQSDDQYHREELHWVIRELIRDCKSSPPSLEGRECFRTILDIGVDCDPLERFFRSSFRPKWPDFVTKPLHYVQTTAAGEPASTAQEVPLVESSMKSYAVVEDECVTSNIIQETVKDKEEFEHAKVSNDHKSKGISKPSCQVS